MLGPRITTWIAWQTVAVSSFTRNASVMSSRKTLASMPLDEKMSPIAQSPKGGLLLKVRVKPGAKVTQLTGDFEDPLGIQVSAPPREGACNEALVEFVCDILNLKKRDVSLISGHKSREKVLALTEEASPKCLLTSQHSRNYFTIQRISRHRALKGDAESRSQILVNGIPANTYGPRRNNLLQVDCTSTNDFSNDFTVFEKLEGRNAGNGVLGLQFWKLRDVYLDKRGGGVVLGKIFEFGCKVHAGA
ncbi:hypothetical protein BaOVIS_020830 [Babesia ovis]|uniref:Uncharacterized protein n=1 Tax=Babesia ovis TaxID=5869 RepID=A0A9W5TAN5_BABOV|nr:hypothetical protein BaOVIS_020830 [Babesia ovis]